MKNSKFALLILVIPVFVFLYGSNLKDETDLSKYVNPFIGTSGSQLESKRDILHITLSFIYDEIIIGGNLEFEMTDKQN